MANITQVISNFPDAPDSTKDTPIEFNNKADAFVHHQADTYNAEVNTWATQANSLKVDMNKIKTDISNITGTIPTAQINDTVTANDKVWSSSKITQAISLKPNIDDARTNRTDTWSSYWLNLSFNEKQDVDRSGNWGIKSSYNAVGSYIKFPDGTMDYFGKTSSKHSTYTLNFAQPFKYVPAVQCIAESTVSATITFKSLSNSSVVLQAWDHLGKPISVKLGWQVRGRWK